MAQSAKGLNFSIQQESRRRGRGDLERKGNCWFAGQDLNKIPVRKEIQDDPEEEGKSQKNTRGQNTQQPTTRSEL
jgi:hypothetical protein